MSGKEQHPNEKSENGNQNPSQEMDLSPRLAKTLIHGALAMFVCPLLVLGAWHILYFLQQKMPQKPFVDELYQTAISLIMNILSISILGLLIVGLVIIALKLRKIHNRRWNKAFMFLAIILWSTLAGSFLHLFLVMNNRSQPDEMSIIAGTEEYHIWAESLNLALNKEEFTRRFNSYPNSPYRIGEWVSDSRRTNATIDAYKCDLSDGMILTIEIKRENMQLSRVGLYGSFSIF